MSFFEFSDYEIVNGMTDMQRDVILKLCRLLWIKVKEIRLIIGMCANHYHWRNHSFFKRSRPFNVPFNLRPNPAGGCFVSRVGTHTECKFMQYEYGDWRTIFSNQSICQGVFQWNVQVKYRKKGSDSLQLTVVPPEAVGLDEKELSLTKGACGLTFGNYRGSYRSFGRSSCGTEGEKWARLLGVEIDNVGNTVVQNNSSITLEIDTDTRTLSFFVDGVRTMFGISGVSVPCYLAMSALGCDPGEVSLTTLYLRRLPAPTPFLPGTEIHPYKPSRYSF